MKDSQKSFLIMGHGIHSFVNFLRARVRFPRIFKGRRGFSNVTSTIILNSVVLAVMVASMFIANDFLEIQIAESEFKSAENLMMTIENDVSRLARWTEIARQEAEAA